MTSEEIDEIVIRKFLSTLTEEEINSSVHLIGMDFNLCEIDDIVDATWSLFLEYQALKRKVEVGLLEENSVAMNDYNSKRIIVKKLFTCDELHTLVVEKGFCEYMKYQELNLKY